MARKGSVLVYGKFRIVHPGHMRLFSHALELGDKLIVGILKEPNTTDDSNFSETLLRNLPFVTDVIVDGDASQIILRAQPDYIVRGFEHRETGLPESDAIKRVGAKVIYTSGNPFLTESDILDGIDQFLKPEIKSPSEYLKRNEIDVRKISTLLSEIGKARVLILGDLIVDDYVTCHAVGMSQEDPIVVNVPISSHQYLGGAGIVAAHCRALGATTNIVSVIGSDETADWAEGKLHDYGINSFLIRDGTRPTTRKQRFKSEKQTLFRLSHFKQHTIDRDLRAGIQEALIELLQFTDLLILSDFSYGVLDEELSHFVISEALNRDIQIAADSQSSSQVGNLGKFKGAHHIFATEREARLQLRNEQDGLAVIAGNLRKELGARNIFLKLGADGVLLDGIDNSSQRTINTERLPALNKNPIDISGAGDSMLAASSLSLSVGSSLVESALVGSIAASIQVSRRGNSPVSLQEVLGLLESSIH